MKYACEKNQKLQTHGQSKFNQSRFVEKYNTKMRSRLGRNIILGHLRTIIINNNVCSPLCIVFFDIFMLIYYHG